jgi:hypothetical protein
LRTNGYSFSRVSSRNLVYHVVQAEIEMGHDPAEGPDTEMIQPSKSIDQMRSEVEYNVSSRRSVTIGILVYHDGVSCFSGSSSPESKKRATRLPRCVVLTVEA